MRFSERNRAGNRSFGALQSWSSEKSINQKADLPLRKEENATYLAFFDPAEGPVLNPGLGVNGYVYIPTTRFTLHLNEQI